MKDLKELTVKEIERYIARYREFLKEEELPDDTDVMSIGTMINYIRMFIDK